VERRDPDLSGIDSLDDAWEQADADTVAKFGILKPQLANFAQHRAAIGVAVRIPASRQ
jgi:hypothetical protein